MVDNNINNNFSNWNSMYNSQYHTPNNSNVFINSQSVSLWMLIVDGLPIFRTEFKHKINDEDVYMLNSGAKELYEELKKNSE